MEKGDGLETDSPGAGGFQARRLEVSNPPMRRSAFSLLKLISHQHTHTPTRRLL